jgi:hypothetical protein
LLANRNGPGVEEGGGGVRGVVHPCYLGHVADEQVERDVPANKRA